MRRPGAYGERDVDESGFAPVYLSSSPAATHESARWRVNRVALGVISGCILLALLVVVSYLRTDFIYDGVAFPVDTSDSRQLALVKQTAQMLTMLMADNLCLACPHNRVALQCIVWNDGAVWLNPVVLERSDGDIAGYETPFMADESERRLVHRAASLTIRHDDDVIEVVTGGAAHCAQFCLDLFDGTHGVTGIV
jgi:peptide deformylase